ncbi:Vomp family autotransporter [Bartonella sp. AA83SXKL]|uniref:Vomp family autotransporter n=1 Tax=Bartonella sp. AA83SXKL TaxID=3243439 RepID=UPI0035CFA78B
MFKVASLGTAVALFLSNDAPVFSANLDLTKASLENVKNAAVVYPQSIISAYDDYNSGMDGYNSVINVLTADGKFAWEDAQNIFTANGTLVSDSKRDKRAKKAVVLDPEKYTAKEKSFTINSMARASGLDGIAIGSVYDNQDSIGEYTFANDYSSKVRVDGNGAIVIDKNAETRAYGNVVLGDGSSTTSLAGASGYSPIELSKKNKNSEVWKSTAHAATIGDYKNKVTRQLEGVAAGSYSIDAVNVAQLKALKTYVDQGWQLSIGGKNATTIGITSTVDLSAASDNLKITKGAEDNNVKFDLANNITVERVTAGRSSISDDGIIFADGARITVDGIDAGNKQITGVAAGEEPYDAVNFAQLQEIKNQIAANSLVKQDGGEEGRITIGIETGGSEINVANKSGEDRIISGVKAAVNNNDAVNKQQLDGQIADVVDTIKSNSLVKREEETNRIIIGKEIEGTEINIANKSGDARAISGVKEAVKDDEAVNKKQLDGEIADITDSIKVIKEANNFAVLYDKNADGTINYNSVTLGGDKTTAPVSLHNVQAGTIAKGSLDAINGSQIEKISEDVANILGGNAEFSDGILFGPLYHLSRISEDGVAVSNVGDALTGLDDNINNVNSRLTHVANEFTQKIEGVSKDSLLWSNDEQAFVAQHGEGRTNSKIKFLANGDISANSTDAINGSQLYLMSNQLAAYFGGGAGYNNGKWTAPTFKITHFKANGSSAEKKDYHDVASAFDGVSESMSKINDRIQNVENNVSSNGLNWNEQKKAYDASHDGQPSKIINVADGKIAEGSKDAVNGGQLWETNERITGVEKDIKHIENRVDNISTTVTNIGETVFNIEDRVDNIENTVNNLSDGAVNYDKDVDGKKTNKITLKGGNESEPVMIDNVADGRIEQGSKEAVNGGQLHDYTEQQMKVVLDQSKHYTDQRVNNIVIDAIDDAVDRAHQYTDMKFNILSYAIEDVRKEARQAAAVGLAVSNLRYFDEPGSLSVSFGSGAWRGQSAFALGAGYTSENGKIRSNLSATSAGGHWGIGGAITLKIK